jgi:hypothetical protein
VTCDRKKAPADGRHPQKGATINFVLEQSIMKFVTSDRRVATSTSLIVLCSVLWFVAYSFHPGSLAAQSSPDQADSSGAQEKQARKLATQMKTITGCLQKGYEPGEFSITGEDGKVWGLRSSAVKLGGHLGHKVTVSGLITHESKAGDAKNGNTESEPGNDESGDLRVSSLKMVSKTCGK